MEKVTVQILIPVLDEMYEVSIPSTLAIRMVIQLLLELVTELSAGKYQPSGTEILCREGTEHVLHESLSFYDYSIKNGEILVLL